MKTATRVVLACAIFAIAATARAADKPNFSGDWKMNAAKSNFGVLPPPRSIARKITHAEPSITIVEDQISDLGEQHTTRAYTTDGKEITFESQGAEVKSAAVWEGDTLVITSNVPIAGLRFIDRMTMSADGTFTSVVHIASPQGEVEIRAVFEK